MRLIDAEPILIKLFPFADKNEDIIKNPYEKAKINAYRKAFEEIYNAPLANAKLIRYGHWKEKWDEDDLDYVYRCSICGESNSYETNYCPHCGAKMDKECKNR